MSSDLFLLDDSFFLHSSSDIVSSDLDLQFLSETFVPFAESPFDILQSVFDDPNQQISADPSPSAVYPLSSSPPIQNLNNLSLSQTTQLQSLPPAANSANGLTDVSVWDTFGVESEECYVGFDSSHYPSFFSNSFGTGKATWMMQRSFSSQSLDSKSGFLFQPRYNSLLESPNFQTQVLDSTESSRFTGPMRRVSSIGDLHMINGFPSSSLAAESSFIEEASFKVGRYSAEERKQRIHRYRSKRTQRNFNKTIKYACRKTLADSRPRVRGRFARNDEHGEIPKVTGFNRDEEDEDEFWGNGYHDEVDEKTMRGEPFVNSFIPTEFQYFGF
ncbi:hypothetical protein HHK36_028993 [Tetracentron sinense]|uniref:CCT domain-containing protein n=1 Tax=Tetracentron sinense TaxID=13715 RepID=A0A834YC82_TETSI|nr:hypothetical protein HHK36_028993 [Tetracentron sinense]